MTLSVGQSIAIIAVCTACTFFERWLPWLLFGRRAVPKVVEYLGKILPMAVMVSLLVYCLRGMQFSAAGAWVPQVIAVGVTAGLVAAQHAAEHRRRYRVLHAARAARLLIAKPGVPVGAPGFWLHFSCISVIIKGQIRIFSCNEVCP